MSDKRKKMNVKKMLIIAAAAVLMIIAAVTGYKLIKNKDSGPTVTAVKRTVNVTPVPVTTYTPRPSSKEQDAPQAQQTSVPDKEGQAPSRQTPQTVESKVDTGSKANVSSIKICIDAGHGLTQKSGKEAVSPEASEKKASHVSGAEGKLITEEEFNLKVAEKLRKLLEQEGYTVTMTRTGHACDLSNIDRANLGNESDFVVRIHADSAQSTSANGISVLIPEKSYYGDPQMVSESKRLGELILENTVQTTGAKNRGTVVRSDMTGFNWSKVPVALIECGFLSNTEEEKKLASDEYQQKLAQGIAQAIRQYCNP